MSVAIVMERDGTHSPWGFTLRGGKDLSEAFVVKKVVFGSPASEIGLRRGDVLVKINDRDTGDMTHQVAHDLIKNAGSKLSIMINRAGQQSSVMRPAAAAPSNPAPQKPTVVQPSQNFSEMMANPLAGLPTTVFPSSEFQLREQAGLVEARVERERERDSVSHQPYRTTPLVLPGAKVKRDVPTQSYLAIQSNAMWNPPAPAAPAAPAGQPAPEVILKQKLEAAAALLQNSAANTAAAQGPAAARAVSPAPGKAAPAEPQPKTEVVVKQFNSPLGLYSQENVTEAMALQTGAIPPQAPRMLDLKHSGTYRALMEEEFQPAKSKEFKPPQTKVVAPTGPVYKVARDGKPEKIAQSSSFNRIMQDCLGETDF